MRKICPLCGSMKTKTLFMASNWGISTCLNCTNAWTEPPPGNIKYDEKNFHSQFGFREVTELPIQWKKGILMQADLLTRYLWPKARILEIGCGEGLFLRELSRRGFDIYGIEASKTAAEFAQKSGLNVITGYFPDTQLSGTFDAVVLSHVLEHIPEPIDFLDLLGKTASGGYILLVQSNWKGLVPRYHKKKWYAWVPEQHIWHFTPKGLELLLKNLNWRVNRVEYSSLSHGNSIVSLIGEAIPRLGDQFHLLASIP